MVSPELHNASKNNLLSMLRPLWLVVIALLILAQQILSAIAAPSEVSGQIPTQAAGCPLPYETTGEEYCSFSIAEYHFVIKQTGRGKRSINDQVTTFKLRLRKGEYIEVLHYASYRRDLIIIAGVTDGESGGGTVYRLRGDSLLVKWILQVPAFNLSEGVIEDESLYLAGIGFVSRIDLEGGKYVWRHGNLYDRDRYSFNSFQRPVLSRKDVKFREELSSGHHKYTLPREIRINKGDGSIVSITK